MRLTPEARSRLAMQHALGLLSPRVARRLERLRHEDPWLEGEMAGSQRQVAQLGLLVTPQAPPVALWSRIEQVLAAPAAARGGAWTSLWLWRTWSVAATAAALAISVLPGFVRQEPVPGTPVVVTGAAPAVPVVPVNPAPDAAAPGTVAVAEGHAPDGAAAGSADAPPPPGVGVAPVDVAAPTPAVAAAGPRPEAAAPAVPVEAAGMGAAGATGSDVAVADAGSATARRGATRGSTRGDAAGAVDAGPQTLALVADDAGVTTWLLRLDATAGVLRVKRLREVPAADGRAYELWVVPDGGGPPRSLGLLPTGDAGEMPLNSRQNRALRAAASLAVSIEASGGSSSGRPSAIAFSGSIVAI
jgi:anti-sigma-K factor RskA